VSEWCAANSTRLNISKTCVMSYSRKTNVLSYEYQLCHTAITCTSSIKDIGVFFDSKLYFHNHVDSMHKAIRPYLLHNLQIFFPGLFIRAVFYISQVQIRICFISLEFYHVH
jgi:hypothetical protein